MISDHYLFVVIIMAQIKTIMDTQAQKYIWQVDPIVERLEYFLLNIEIITLCAYGQNKYHHLENLITYIQH